MDAKYQKEQEILPLTKREKMSWELFRKVCEERYISELLKDKKQLEIDVLVQGQMTAKI